MIDNRLPYVLCSKSGYLFIADTKTHICLYWKDARDEKAEWQIAKGWDNYATDLIREMTEDDVVLELL